MSKAGEQDFLTVARFQKVEDGFPFQATPFLVLIVGAEDCNNEIGFVAVKFRQIEGEVVTGKLSLMKFVVENRSLGESGSEQVGDLFHEVPVFTSKGESNAEAFRTHSPSFLNRLFTSLKWKSSEQSFSNSPFLKYFATSGSAFRTSTKSASSRPACFTSHVFIALRWTRS